MASSSSRDIYSRTKTNSQPRNRQLDTGNLYLPPSRAPDQESTARDRLFRGVTASILTDAHERLIGRDAEAELIDAVVDQLPDRGGGPPPPGGPGVGEAPLLPRRRPT